MKKYTGAYYQRSTNKFNAKCRANGQDISIGWYDTAEEAHAEYVAYKAKIVYQLSATDLKNIKQYKEFLKFCEKPRFSSEFYAKFDNSNITLIRYILRMLEDVGCIKIDKISGHGQPKLHYTKINDFDAASYVPRAEKQKTLKPVYNRDVVEPRRDININELPYIPSFIISYKYADIPKEAKIIKERHVTRAPTKLARNYPGTSYGSAIW